MNAGQPVSNASSGSRRTPCYVPILSGNAAEYWAWGHTGLAVTAMSRPVFEVVPKGNPNDDLKKFRDSIVPICFQKAVLTVDTGRLGQTQLVAGFGIGPVLWIAQELHSKYIPAKPVVRLGDDASVLAEVAAAAALHGHGICLRLGSPGNVPNDIEVSRQWPRISSEVGLPTTEVDLLIDFCGIDQPGKVGPATARATSLLNWANHNGPWRSVTIASGAFPSSIHALPLGMSTPIRRYDADFFSRVVASNPPFIPDFGDYGVRSPTRLSGGGGRPTHPNLRYTSGSEWQVYREDRYLPNGGAIRALCSNVMGSSHWPSTGSSFSAGDAEIDLYARTSGGGRKPTYWLRWSTSHHFEHVIGRLLSLGLP